MLVSASRRWLRNSRAFGVPVIGAERNGTLRDRALFGPRPAAIPRRFDSMRAMGGCTAPAARSTSGSIVEKLISRGAASAVARY